MCIIFKSKAQEEHKLQSLEICSVEPTDSEQQQIHMAGSSPQIIQDSVMPPGTALHGTIETELNWNMSQVC